MQAFRKNMLRQGRAIGKIESGNGDILLRDYNADILEDLHVLFGRWDFTSMRYSLPLLSFHGPSQVT